MDFVSRHIGPSIAEQEHMLAALGYASLDELTAAALPEGLAHTGGALSLPAPLSEPDVLAELRRIAAANQVKTSMIGLGYYGTITPAVLRRNILENPGWYTAYTPYQPEISQGRLEALVIFQTMVADLTGLPLAGASLLDEATAAAEAMTLARRAAASSSPTHAACRRRWRCWPPGPSRSASTWSWPRSRPACWRTSPPVRCSACCCPTPTPAGRSATCAR
jgi:glycine cleavage system P protein (glycine dehydrogenase)